MVTSVVVGYDGDELAGKKMVRDEVHHEVDWLSDDNEESHC